MQWFQTETPRIENQFNQPLSSAVIFLPSPSISWLPSVGVGSWKREKDDENGSLWTGMYNWEECSILCLYCLEFIAASFVKFLLHYDNAVQLPCLAQNPSKNRPNFLQRVLNLSCIIIDWKVLSLRLNPDWILCFRPPPKKPDLTLNIHPLGWINVSEGWGEILHGAKGFL